MSGALREFTQDKALYPISWAKAMMWLFLLSDTFIFGFFLLGYMSARIGAIEPWPPIGEVFSLTLFGHNLPLLLIAIMTFVLITSSGTMAMAVNFAYRAQWQKVRWLLLGTALLGLTFVSMQVFEWSKLIFHDGIRPWHNPLGAVQFGACFFLLTGFHGMHVSAGVILLLWLTHKTRDPSSCNAELVETTGLYWHFVDLVWVFIFAFFYLW